MAYGTPPETPRTKPSTVKFSVILLYVVAASSLISGLIGLLTYSAYTDTLTKMYEGTSLEGSASSSTATQVGGSIAISVVLAIIFVVLAILVSRGSRVGRILTWVFGGLALCCIGGFTAVGLLFGEAAWNASREQNPTLPTYAEYERQLDAALPSWYGPVSTILGVVTLLALLGAIILLALPASHPYFRKREEPLWEPPIPPAPGGPAGPSGPTGPTGPTTPPPAESGPAT
jgi:hypothetical protein